jgi:3-oxoacyl-[acyl-carrier protein] reductase
MLSIEGAVAVITGGAGGIGLALARYWLANGGRVVIADSQRAALDQAAASLAGEVLPVLCNVTREEECARLADAAMERFGAIHLVAPFAGQIRDGLLISVDRQTGKTAGKMPLDQFQQVIDVHVSGTFLTVRECLERMVDHGCRGLLCLMASTGALGTAGQINYSAAKAAIAVMPKVITAELSRRGLAHRIRCVAVAPGYVDTAILAGMDQKALARVLEQVPIGRLIAPEEVAGFVGELFRNEALAGEVFFIHGGLRLGSRG